MAAIADRIQLGFVEESTYGVNPTGSNLQKLRITAESLAKSTNTTQSAEIRPDRQVSDVIRTGISVEGGFDFELSYGSFDKLIAAALFSADFGSVVVIVDDDANLQAQIVAATGVLTAVGQFGSGVAVGDWIKLSNFSNAANNVLVKVLELIDADNIKIAGAAALADETVAADAAGANAKIVKGASIKNGTNQRSFTFERGYTDLTKFATFRGLVPESLSLSVSADAIVTGSFAFRGKDEDALASSSPNAGYDNATVSPVMNAIDNVLSVLEGDLAVNQSNSLAVTSVSLEVQNNLRDRMIVGSLGADSIGAGKVAVTGSLQAYFNNQSAADKYLNFDKTAVTVLFQDVDGNVYVVELPRVKFTQGTKVAGGENSDVVLDMAFSAYRHEVEDATIRVVKISA